MRSLAAWVKHVTIFQIKLFSFSSSLSGFLPRILSFSHAGLLVCLSITVASFCPCVCLSGFNRFFFFFLPIALAGLIFFFLFYSQAFSFFSLSLCLCLCLSLIPVCLPSFFPLWLLSLSLELSVSLSQDFWLLSLFLSICLASLSLSLWFLSLSPSFLLSRSDFWLCYNAAGWHRGNFFLLSSAVCFVCFVYCGYWEIDELICRPGWCMSGR